MFLDIVLNIITSGLPCALLALGIFLTYRLLDFADLTAEGSFLIGAAVSGVMIFNGVNPWIATIASFVAGGICGLVTGILNRFVKIPKLLSGIITMTAAVSIAMIIMGLQKGASSHFMSQVTFSITKNGPSQTIYSLFYPWKFDDVGGRFIVVAPWGDVITAVVMFAVVVIAMLGIYFFFGTEYGMAIRATGMNEKMAKAQGINTDVSTIVCIALSNALIGLGGSLYAQQVKTVTTISASGYLVVGLASILIGEAIFGKRSFKNWLIAVALGSILYFIIITIATRLGLDPNLLKLLYAVLIVIALAIGIIKNKVKGQIDAKRKRRNAQ